MSIDLSDVDRRDRRALQIRARVCAPRTRDFIRMRASALHFHAGAIYRVYLLPVAAYVCARRIYAALYYSQTT